ncbi:zinc finger BED domain-containing protein RICESLEEPER 2-like [Tripterygium wilfordii]|uniref:zinc finger BED domain-containing protein RICESLEEPER 2-like n=1 Tax=Tripterygium wilfordii TaxID=458696 RepID=UPI0018F8040D|nr:zinc finger BED domain-containing protein RICESLEEPER 2-like [Tripterygium wilfordii]
MEKESPTVGSTPTTQSAPTVGESASAPPIQTSPNVGAENEVISNSNRTSIEENIEENSRNNRKHKSPAWDHFEEKYVGGKRKAMCPDCKKVLGGQSKNRTKHLLDHMKSCLYKKQKTINQSILNPTKSNDGSMKLGTYTFDQNQAREELAKMITLHGYPLSMVQHVGFKRFIYVPCPHTAEVLTNAFIDCLLDWNLDCKLSTLTVDNCTTNDVMIEVILDKIPPMSFWTATPKRDEKFVEAACQLKVPSTKKLKLDCKTRWNSTYLMLNTALIYKDVFPRLKQRETLYKRVPTEEEWSKVRDICSKLEMFFDATELFSGTLYPTIDIFFSHICQIKLAIDEWIRVDDIDVKIMASKMKVKFDKYWDIMNYLLAIGSILDPRYKMKMIEFYYPLVYGDTSSSEIEKISSRPPLPKRGAYATRFEMFLDSTPTNEHVKSEMDHYLEESLLPRNTHDFDILCWWKTNDIKYPTLHDIAKDVLSIPVTIVA